MVTLRHTETEDIKTILNWNNLSEFFLKQWSNFTYPLTGEQYIERIISEDFCVFSIDDDGELVGTVQIFKINKENKTATVGCYLINPLIRGKGIGTKAFELITEYAFHNMNLEKLELCVWDYNTGAIKCYENAGYIKTGEYEHLGCKGYNMERCRIRA